MGRQLRKEPLSPVLVSSVSKSGLRGAEGTWSLGPERKPDFKLMAPGAWNSRPANVLRGAGPRVRTRTAELGALQNAARGPAGG